MFILKNQALSCMTSIVKILKLSFYRVDWTKGFFPNRICNSFKIIQFDL